MSEFDEWAKRFEFKQVLDEWDAANSRYTYKQVPLDEPKCMYPMKEGPHKVAHLVKATTRSVDGYPACSQHARREIRKAWRGYVEGA